MNDPTPRAVNGILAIMMLIIAIPILLMAAKSDGRTGSIGIGTPADLRFAGEVSFTSEVTSKLKGFEYPMIYVACEQDGELVYGQLDHPEAVFVLGGGSSAWVSRGGGAAHCRASLLIYGGMHNVADQFVAAVEFEAGP